LFARELQRSSPTRSPERKLILVHLNSLLSAKLQENQALGLVHCPLSLLTKSSQAQINTEKKKVAVRSYAWKINLQQLLSWF
jgi:hypothetical protein